MKGIFYADSSLKKLGGLTLSTKIEWYLVRVVRGAFHSQTSLLHLWRKSFLSPRKIHQQSVKNPLYEKISYAFSNE